MPELRTIATYQTTEEAHLGRIFLEQEGIEAEVENEHFELLEEVWPANGVRLSVRAADVERATEVLRSHGRRDDSSGRDARWKCGVG